MTRFGHTANCDRAKLIASLGSDDVERIFDAFFTTKTKQGGLGLGLSISRTIIEAHGGRLWATLNEDHGATFQFTLATADESQA